MTKIRKGHNIFFFFLRNNYGRPSILQGSGGATYCWVGISVIIENK